MVVFGRQVSELSDCMPEHAQHLDEITNLDEITISFMPWRDASTFSDITATLIRRTLRTPGDLPPRTLDALLSHCWYPSDLDIYWLHNLLCSRSLARRDAFWCKYLYLRYDDLGPDRRLIDAAFELSLDGVDAEVAERWALALLWFTAAADRRVKDEATRALVNLMNAYPASIEHLINMLTQFDDDDVRERLLLSSYAALLTTRHSSTGTIATTLLNQFVEFPLQFDNAIIRDLVRCVGELAQQLNYPTPYAPGSLSARTDREWKLDIPSESDLKKWQLLPRLAHSCLSDNFFTYSMNCLQPWNEIYHKSDCAKWILSHIVNELQYMESGCEMYDEYMWSQHGGGRGRDKWADRIGKKYQWISLHRLAARLHDTCPRRGDNWKPDPQCAMPILLEERKMDPTLAPSQSLNKNHHEIDSWRVGDKSNLLIHQGIDDAEWVKKIDNLPDPRKLAGALCDGKATWRLLLAYLGWDSRTDKSDYDTEYRDI